MKGQLLLISFLFLFNTAIQAATIQINSRAITNGIDNTDFISTWNNQSSFITSKSLTKFTSFKSGRNSLSHLSVGFNVGKNTQWGFEAGLDAHYGAMVFLDGNLIGQRQDDLWWSRNWNHSDVISLLGNSLLSGAHTLDVYWAEKCCDGPSSLRFRTNENEWLALTVENLEAASVPEPWTIWIMLIGAACMIRTHKQNTMVF